jgi:hypothetical protein
MIQLVTKGLVAVFTAPWVEFCHVQRDSTTASQTVVRPTSGQFLVSVSVTGCAFSVRSERRREVLRARSIKPFDVALAVAVDAG